MSFFNYLLQSKGLTKHNGNPLWKYMLTNEDFEKLKDELKNTIPIYIDPRDVTLYYAEYWKKNYNGGKPSKQDVFDSLNGNINYHCNANDFYKLARRGAKILGFKWIAKQNTLYFRTLLLQGGLPLTHISENQSNYHNFLLAVLEEQPETIEDFIFKPHIINLLPQTSQNDIIYESCFEIVKSILNDEKGYDDLLGSNEALISISKSLKTRKQSLKKIERVSKPKNYWLLNNEKGKVFITLKIGLANFYNSESLSNILGFEITGNEYQLYVNEELICVFKKMLNGKFKTDWYQQQDQIWNGESNLPNTYIIENGVKFEVNDFIQTVPNLNEPSLWVKFSDNEWRLIKGNGTPNKEAAILLPKQWNTDLTAIELTINSELMSWLVFEGEVAINFEEEYRKYLSNVNALEWSIESQKPFWIQKASMPVVQKKPTIHLFDENDKIIPKNKSKIWVRKYNSKDNWEELSRLSCIPVGCLELKIEKEDLIAYDKFFNVGNLQAIYTLKSIDKATIQINNNNFFQFKLDESPILEIEERVDRYVLKVKTAYSKIPLGIKGSVGLRNQRKLFFEMVSPFEGMAITNKEGKIIGENEPLSLSNLYGLRILCTPNKETMLRIYNETKKDVIINKAVQESSQPVISLKDEITRLYYLSDAMDYKNKVCLEIKEGRNSKKYEIAGFSHTLNVDEQYENKVRLYNSNDELDLYAIPLNCESKNIELIPLCKNEGEYLIPETEITNQFIIISSKENDTQLMPRFVNTEESNQVSTKEERIEEYHNVLLEACFQDEIWKQLLIYFNICVENEIPFSTFDQLWAISKSSKVAARAFFYLGINQLDTDNYVQKSISEFEKDLGFCFHWINKDNWEIALDEVDELYNGQFFENIIGLLSSYMQENGFDEIFKFISSGVIQKEVISQSDIRELRAKLGERVLKELPYASPKITKEYHIPINDHRPVKLLLRAPIAVAESINDIQKEYPIWAGDDHRESIRRNIQYSQYLNPEFYKRTILHALKDN